MEPDLQTPIKSTIPYTFAQTTKISEVPQLCDERARVLRYPNTPTDMLGHVRWQFWHSFSCGEHEKSAASLTLGLSFFLFSFDCFFKQFMCPFDHNWGPGPDSITGQMGLLCSGCFWSRLLSCVSMCDSHPHLYADILSPLWQLHHPVYQSFNLFKIVLPCQQYFIISGFPDMTIVKTQQSHCSQGMSKAERSFPPNPHPGKLCLLMWRGEEEEKRRRGGWSSRDMRFNSRLFLAMSWGSQSYRALPVMINFTTFAVGYSA